MKQWKIKEKEKALILQPTRIWSSFFIFFLLSFPLLFFASKEMVCLRVHIGRSRYRCEYYIDASSRSILIATCYNFFQSFYPIKKNCKNEKKMENKRGKARWWSFVFYGGWTNWFWWRISASYSERLFHAPQILSRIGKKPILLGVRELHLFETLKGHILNLIVKIKRKSAINYSNAGTCGLCCLLGSIRFSLSLFWGPWPSLALNLSCLLAREFHRPSISHSLMTQRIGFCIGDHLFW